MTIPVKAAYRTLRLEHEGPIDWLTLDRPERLNALDGPMCDELQDYFGALVTTSLSVDSIAGAVSDFTGYTKDTGGGGFDALMMWRTMS